jgi:hypothetical protein
MLLIVRREQMEALNAQALESFHRRMRQHLAALFPERVAAWGEEGARGAADAGIRQAAGFGITAERDVARFIDLTVELGPDFPDREATAWTRSVLEDRHASAATRMSRLYQRLERQLPGATHLWQAWR